MASRRVDPSIEDLGNLAERLKEARERKSLSLEELAVSVGVSYDHLKRLESKKNKSAPNAFLLARLALVLGVSVDYLLGATTHSDTRFAAQLIQSTFDLDMGNVSQDELLEILQAIQEVRAKQLSRRERKREAGLGLRKELPERKH